MSEKEKFGSFGALMAMAGSAVGLGNIWRFPFLVGENGGAAFLIIYVSCVFLIALPIFFCEFIVGRRSGKNCFGAMEALSGGQKKWKTIGLIEIFTPVLIVSYYSVIGGWGVEYLFKASTFEFSRVLSQTELSGMFKDFASSIWAPLLGHTIFLGACVIILSRGVKDGIEKFGKVAMPALFLIVVLMAVYVAFLDGASGGYKYMFKPDFSKVTPPTVYNALGQAFFSLSLGCGCIVTFASYVRKKESAFRHCTLTALMDLFFALIAGCAIMPAVFAFGVDPASGPSLVFETLPFIFSKMPGGSVVAIFFFTALLVAALTSAISLIEVVVAYLVEEKKMRRTKASWLVFAITWTIGCISSLSFGPLSSFRIAGKSFFSLMDFLSSNVMMTLGSILIVIFVGWVMKRKDVHDEFTYGGRDRRSNRIFNSTYFIIKFIAPAAISIIFITGLFFK